MMVINYDFIMIRKVCNQGVNHSKKKFGLEILCSSDSAFSPDSEYGFEKFQDALEPSDAIRQFDLVLNQRIIFGKAFDKLI